MVVGLINAQIDPLIHYSFDDITATEAIDVSGNDNHGEFHDTAVWVEGIKGHAVEFTDTMCVVVPFMSMTSGTGSVAMWLKCDTNKNSNDIRCFYWAGNPNNPDAPGLGNGFGGHYEMHMHFESTTPDIWAGGECSFWAKTETGDADSTVHLFSDPDKGTSAGTTPVNPLIITDSVNWHHVAGVWDGNGNKISLYIDGELIMEKDFWPGTAYDLTHMFLGKMGGNNRRYKGGMDEVRIFDVALTLADIEEIITEDTTKVGVNESAINALSIHVSPNPAANFTRIGFTLEKSAHVTATVYNIAGAKIADIYNKEAVKGYNSFSYNVSDLPSGVYFIRMEAAGKTGFNKLVVK